VVEPDWAKLLDAVLKTAPATVQISAIDVDDTTVAGSVAVTVHADASATPFADLERWARDLAGNPAVSNVFAPSAESDAQPDRSPSKTTFDLRFDVTREALQSARPFGASVP
jgi:hypothetical protein